jgi:hypothetical protein
MMRHPLVVLALAIAAALCGCSSPDEFSVCVRKCMAIDDPPPGSECIRICEHHLERGGGGEAAPASAGADEGSER